MDLYTNLEQWKICPDFPLLVFAFVREMLFIKTRFPLAKVYSNTKQRLSQIDPCKYLFHQNDYVYAFGSARHILILFILRHIYIK